MLKKLSIAAVSLLAIGAGVAALSSDDKVENEAETDKKIEEALAKLNDMIGLEKVKKEIEKMTALIKFNIKRKKEDPQLIISPAPLHMVFTGNPGTGKTTVARLMGDIYKALGVLPSNKVIETDRSGLVGGYVGQTALKTKKVIKSAMGGILFIDEAYSLAPGYEEDFGREAIDTLLKEMEDKRDKLAIIVAGYKENMDDFIHSNPGLKSRFTRFIEFDDYTPQELTEIFLSLTNKQKITLLEGAKDAIKEGMTQAYDYRGENFANGRMVRNIFDKSYENMALRLSQSKEGPTGMAAQDIKKAFNNQ